MDSVCPTDGADQSLAVARLRSFRDEAFGCLGRRGDALFELVDALLTAESMPSLPHLSLLPIHRRGWGSAYAALAVGEVDADRLAEVVAAQAPEVTSPVFAVDASTWARCDAECSPGRGFYYSPTRHSAGQPIVAGWCYSWIAQLGFDRDSWTAPLDARRVPAGEDVGRVTAAQIRALTGRLRVTETAPMFVFDAGYDPIALTVDLADLPLAVLVRIRSDRVFYAAPTSVPGRLGRPPRHGARFLCADPTSWPAPEQALQVDDEQYGQVSVQSWPGLHPKLAGRGRWSGCPEPPIVPGTVIRVQVEHLPRPTARAVKTLWLWWAGSGRPDLDRCWRAYIRRFDLEHTFRFCKQALSWTTPGGAPQSRPTAGPGWCSSPTPSCTWPAPSPLTPGCPGNGAYPGTGSPRPESDEISPGCCPSWARQPAHRNPAAAPQDDRPAADEEQHPASQQSRRPPPELKSQA